LVAAITHRKVAQQQQEFIQQLCDWVWRKGAASRSCTAAASGMLCHDSMQLGVAVVIKCVCVPRGSNGLRTRQLVVILLLLLLLLVLWGQRMVVVVVVLLLLRLLLLLCQQYTVRYICWPPAVAVRQQEAEQVKAFQSRMRAGQHILCCS
jgi:hypothetical protein